MVEFDAEVDGLVFVVGVPVGFWCGCCVEGLVSVLVCGAYEVLAVADEDVPDDDGVFDSWVFLIEEAAVE